MKLKLFLLSLLFGSMPVLGWIDVWQIYNKSSYWLGVKSANSKSGDNQNGIRMIIPPPVNIGCGLKTSGQSQVDGDVHECEFFMPPGSSVIKTWGFYIGDSAHGNYSVFTVYRNAPAEASVDTLNPNHNRNPGNVLKTWKVQDVSYGGNNTAEYVRMNDDDSKKWDGNGNYNVILNPDMTLDLVRP